MLLESREQACFIARVLNSSRCGKYVVTRNGGGFEIKQTKLPKLSKEELETIKHERIVQAKNERLSLAPSEKREFFIEIVEKHFYKGKSYRQLSYEYDMNIATIADWCKKYRLNGYKLPKDIFCKRKARAWRLRKDDIALVLEKRSQGYKKSEIIEKFDITLGRYQYVSVALSRQMFMEEQEYIELLEKYNLLEKYGG